MIHYQIKIYDATQAGTVDNTTGVTLPVNPGDAVSISEFDRAELTGVLDEVASLRAQSGGKLSTLGFVSDYLDVKSLVLHLQIVVSWMPTLPKKV